MADQVTVTNLPDSGSRERVAYDLCAQIRRIAGAPKSGTLAEVARAHLALYAECYKAASGHDFDTSKLT